MYSESDSDFEEAGELDPLDAGKEFADFLLELRMLQKLSARDVCLLAYYAKHAGVVGYARDYAFPPGKRSGHYQRHLDTVTNMSTTLDQKYVMEVPGSTKFYNARTKLQLPCLPPHECLQAEVSESPNLREDLRDALSQEPDWLDTYTAHPVVTSAKPGEVVYPLAIYSDGVPFQRRDGALLFFIYNLVSGTRHLVATLRKSELCKCGCLGYCSVFQVWLLFKWGIMALAEGVYPTLRHNGAVFSEGIDTLRSSLGGTKLVKCAVVHIKADWLEYASSMSLPRWSDVHHPCFKCFVNKLNFDNIGSFSVVSDAFPAKKAVHYDKACADAEFWVTIADDKIKKRLCTILKFTGKPGHHGRVLIDDFGELNLRRHDRLEMHMVLQMSATSTKYELLAVCCFGGPARPVWRREGALFSCQRQEFPWKLVLWTRCMFYI